MNKLNVIFSIVVTFLLFTNPAIADGLADATAQITEIQTWLYSILFFVSLIYMIYQVVMAMAEKQEWREVITAFVKVAMAGASVVGATWAWGIWGS